MKHYHIEEIDQIVDRPEEAPETVRAILAADIVIYHYTPIEAALAYTDRVYELYSGEDISVLTDIIRDYDDSCVA